MIDAYDLTKISDKKLRNYMIKYLCMMMTISSVYLIKRGKDEDLQKKEELWNYLENANQEMYKKIRTCILGRSMNLKGKSGRKIIIIGYKISKKMYGFC